MVFAAQRLFRLAFVHALSHDILQVPVLLSAQGFSASLDRHGQKGNKAFDFQGNAQHKLLDLQRSDTGVWKILEELSPS